MKHFLKLCHSLRAIVNLPIEAGRNNNEGLLSKQGCEAEMYCRAVFEVAVDLLTDLPLI